MKVRKNREETKDPDLDMTPMIDIVFQLLIFFVMTFKIVTLEGDFDVKMPRAAPSPQAAPLPPIRLTMQADAEGNLAGLLLDRKPVPDFATLRSEVIALVGGTDAQARAETEIELDVDYQLKYQHVIGAITAVTGYVRDDQIQKLIERVKFAQPRQPAG